MDRFHLAPAPTVSRRLSSGYVLRSAAIRWRRSNAPLLAGSLIVLVFIGIAFLGPALAPNDPLERSFAVRIDGTWTGPPFPPLTPGYPLGSDRFGRDLWSRLLWGVRPTMLMVALVAITRLTVGSALGVLAGWSTGIVGRAIQSCVSAALSLPILLVALGAIAGVGIERGLLAFIIGLSVTGWAESARLIATQTQATRRQPYIEAARALGGSDTHLLLQHVLRHILPLLTILFAFEVSATLMSTAALGFLGYYIGGGAWIATGDFVASNAAGLPELGQMLGTSLENLLKPWPMVVVGTVIFVAILGFNLLGEGLRRRTVVEQRSRRTLWSWIGRVLQLRTPAQSSPLPRRRWSAGNVLIAVVGTALIVSSTRLAWLSMRDPAEVEQREAGIAEPPGSAAPTLTATPVSSSHLWGAQRYDAAGTIEVPVRGPTTATVAWEFEDAEGFAGGPAVAANGTVYVVSKAGILYALDPAGTVKWQTQLEQPGVGAPALGPAGEIYVADHLGLSSIDHDGTVRWRYESGRAASSGPIVAGDGTVFYSLGDRVQAVSSDGKPLWLSPPASIYTEMPPRLSPSGALVFLKDAAYSTDDGQPQQFELDQGAEGRFTNPSYLIGADGKSYYLSGHTLIRWSGAASAAEAQAIPWDSRSYESFFPADVGVTRDQNIWLFYAGPFGDLALVWLDKNGRVLSAPSASLSDGRLIAMGAGSTAYICGSRPNRRPECIAYTPGAREPTWQVVLEKGRQVVGGALVPGRLYLTTADGFLFAIGSG